MPWNHKLFKPVQNIHVHPNNINKTSKRLHNECKDMMKTGINDNCPPLLYEMEVGVVQDVMIMVCMAWSCLTMSCQCPIYDVPINHMLCNTYHVLFLHNMSHVGSSCNRHTGGRVVKVGCWSSPYKYLPPLSWVEAPHPLQTLSPTRPCVFFHAK